ncbi:GNAT family N-acetyltransferase [Pseudooceanicola onchidii]|uniref:GNAT family N-acetyltransferase n=1 Tax=Pseudooceanicola onchidii TaxID=2562279 RepID=UPI0010AA301B|nr:GNAT family N-acetyltransferase [Pseudooceanicola onchidii]
MTPVRLGPGDPSLLAVLTLLHDSFAYMEGRIDPPSSLREMTLASLARDAEVNELWGLFSGDRLLACVILTPKPDHLYLGKLAVARDARGTGLARQLVTLALDRTRQLRLPALRLQTRVELTENQAAFARLGFREIARTAHAGYDRPTSVTMQREV